jgi:hypothetical protein
MVPDDCSTILVVSVLISRKNAERLGATPDPSITSGADEIGGTIMGESAGSCRISGPSDRLLTNHCDKL